VLLENENLRKLLLMPQIDGGLERCLCHQMKANETFGFVDVRAPAWPGCKGRPRHIGRAELQDHNRIRQRRANRSQARKVRVQSHGGVAGSRQR